MGKLTELHEIDDLEKVWTASKEKPVLLFKQSTTCPISAEAFNQYQSFLEESDADLSAYFVKVRETREVSNQITEDLDVRHQSPQILLVKDEKSVWDASHTSITAFNIKQAIKDN